MELERTNKEQEVLNTFQSYGIVGNVMVKIVHAKHMMQSNVKECSIKVS